MCSSDLPGGAASSHANMYAATVWTAHEAYGPESPRSHTDPKPFDIADIAIYPAGMHRDLLYVPESGMSNQCSMQLALCCSCYKRSYHQYWIQTPWPLSSHRRLRCCGCWKYYARGKLYSTVWNPSQTSKRPMELDIEYPLLPSFISAQGCWVISTPSPEDWAFVLSLCTECYTSAGDTCPGFQ